jgi:hypothetical protein
MNISERNRLQRNIRALKELQIGMGIVFGRLPEKRIATSERRRDDLKRRPGGDIRSGRDRRFRMPKTS